MHILKSRGKDCLKWHAYIRTNSSSPATFCFRRSFCFCRLINKNMLEWFLLVMCKEYTLTGSTNLFSRNHSALCFWLRREVLINFWSNCPECYNEFLDSCFFNLRKYLFRTFPDSHFWNHTYSSLLIFQLRLIFLHVRIFQLIRIRISITMTTATEKGLCFAKIYIKSKWQYIKYKIFVNVLQCFT